jgi:LAO/AO transport system ATPase
MKAINDLVDQGIALHKKSTGELISLFEDSRPEFAEKRKFILQSLKNASKRNAVFIGITGAPGSGKSSLIGRIAPELITAKPDIAVAVLAIDPTSKITGGSILGDRIRARFSPAENRLFFRSQASANEIGGTGRNTFQVSRLLKYLFDIVIIETVGTGQEDTEITNLTDKTFLVLQPNSGDRIQFIKSGIMEIPDCIILNKSDVNHADESFYEIENTLQMLETNRRPLLFKTSTVTGMGLDQIIVEILNIKKKTKECDTELFYFKKWVQTEFGNYGISIIEKSTGFEGILSKEKDFDRAIMKAKSIILKSYNV